MAPAPPPRIPPPPPPRPPPRATASPIEPATRDALSVATETNRPNQRSMKHLRAGLDKNYGHEAGGTHGPGRRFRLRRAHEGVGTPPPSRYFGRRCASS